MTTEEYYPIHFGEDRLFNSNKMVHDSTDVIEFADFYYAEEVKLVALNAYKQGFKDAVDALQAANESVQKTQLP